MPPQNTGLGGDSTVVTNRKSVSHKSGEDIKSEEKEWNYWDHIYYSNIFWFILLHVGAVYGVKLCFTDAKWTTILFGKFQIPEFKGPKHNPSNTEAKKNNSKFYLKNSSRIDLQAFIVWNHCRGPPSLVPQGL